MNKVIKTVLTACLSVLMGAPLNAQDKSWLKESTPSGTFLIGAGPNFLGFNAKAGTFLKKGVLIGVNAEVHHFLSTRKEAGVFARKYLNSNRVSFFLQGGVGYGNFEVWNFGFDIDKPPVEREEPYHYRELKLNVTGGGEIKLSRRFGLEGEAGYGKILNSSWWAPSIRASLNYRILR
ncbi:MAG: hypothetical protein LRY55_14995 [Leadbetterella sp.]|nr:hypothetical protein [Leadbetterella sp.]